MFTLWQIYVIMKFFELTKADYDRLVEECMLDDEYKKLLEYKIKGYSRIKIATIQKLKKKITKVLQKPYKSRFFFYAIIYLKGDNTLNRGV